MAMCLTTDIPKYMKQELVELKGEIDKVTILFGHFNVIST